MHRPLSITGIGIFFLVFFIFSLIYPLFSSYILEKYNVFPQLLNTPLPMVINSVAGSGYSAISYFEYQAFTSKYPSDDNTEGLVVVTTMVIGTAGLAGAIGILKAKNWGRLVIMTVSGIELFFSAFLISLQTFIHVPTLLYSAVLLLWLSRGSIKEYFR